VALNGYAAALPDAVGAGLGSLVTIDAADERSGTSAHGNAVEDGTEAQRSAHSHLAIARAKPRVVGRRSILPGTSSHDVTSASRDDEASASTPPGPAEPGTESGPTTSPTEEATGSGKPSPSPDNPSRLSVAAGRGSGLDASVGSEGLTLDADGESGVENSGVVGVEITDADGSSTGIAVDVPGQKGVMP
jgi:hypothetical protein